MVKKAVKKAAGSEAASKNNLKKTVKTTKASEPLATVSATAAIATDRAIPAREINPKAALQASRRFWSLFLGVAILLVGLIQGYGYITGWGNPERVIQRHFNNAQRYTLGKRYESAIHEYEKILKKSKDDEVKRQALIAMAECYGEDKAWPKAIELYNQLCTQDGGGVMAAWAGLKTAEAYMESGNAAAALEKYRTIQEKYPKSDWEAEARLGIGKVLASQDKNPEAVAAFVALDKDYHGGFLAAEALTQVGMIYAKSGQADNARLIYEKLIKEYPEAMTDDAKKLLKRLGDNQKPNGVSTWGKED